MGRKTPSTPGYPMPGKAPDSPMENIGSRQIVVIDNGNGGKNGRRRFLSIILTFCK
ncbi:MAG: hypothetical protein KDD10_03865 [Phaeodactylibacter sp.]|nr:hypothetical protein [Phaeodactylibacter sp.]MCB9291666.1 hypothetical protein [Lewinellaceae bacterium]